MKTNKINVLNKLNKYVKFVAYYYIFIVFYSENDIIKLNSGIVIIGVKYSSTVVIQKWHKNLKGGNVMEGKKKYFALIIFLFLGLMIFTFANPAEEEKEFKKSLEELVKKSKDKFNK